MTAAGFDLLTDGEDGLEAIKDGFCALYQLPRHQVSIEWIQEVIISRVGS